MSAWIVSINHIDALVCGGIHYEVPFNRQHITSENATSVGKALLSECIKSVKHRYPHDRPLLAKEVVYHEDGTINWDNTPDHGLPGPVPTPSVRAYQFIGETTLQPLSLIKQIGCYHYQSCEHPGWKRSASKRFCDDLTNAVLRAIEMTYTEIWDNYPNPDHPEFAAAPWGID